MTRVNTVMTMHGIPFPIGGFGILFLCVAVALGGFYLIRKMLDVRQPGRPAKSRRNEQRLDSALTDAEIYRLAKRLNGRLTVSDVVIATGSSLSDSERALDRIADGMRVTMRVTDRGSVVYEFPELNGSSTSAESAE